MSKKKILIAGIAVLLFAVILAVILINVNKGKVKLFTDSNYTCMYACKGGRFHCRLLYDDMRKTIKTEAAKKVPEVKKAKEMKKEQAKQKEARQAAKKAEAKRQLKQPKKAAQAPARA